MSQPEKFVVDARGLDCPMPVLNTKKALEAHEQGAVTIVDNEIAMRNIVKLAENLNYTVEVVERDNCFHIYMEKGVFNQEQDLIPESKPDFLDMVILVGKAELGDGDKELGEILMKGYVYTLTESKPYPKALIFVNSGVYLTVDHSPVIENLRKLEAAGVEILSCGTCLDYYQLKGQLAVGGVTNMYTVVETMNNAKNTIRL